jgi:hypothetical protein
MWRLDNGEEEEDNNNYFGTPKWNKPTTGKQKHRKQKTTINSDLFLVAEFGNEAGTDAMEDEGGNDSNNDDGPTAKPKKYAMTKKKDQTVHARGGGQCIGPVPYTRTLEHFKVKLEKGNFEEMQDKHGKNCIHLVFDWLLPILNKGLDKNGLYKFVSTRMCNYMIQIMKKQTFKLEHYDPFDKKYITADHITRFLGVSL